MAYTQLTEVTPETLSDRLTNLEALQRLTEYPSLMGTRFYAGGIAPIAATSGTDTAGVNGTVWIGELKLCQNTLITGLAYLIGSVGGTDKAIAMLFSSSGALLANSAVAGATVGTAATFQNLDFTTAYQANPGLYFVGIQFNGTTAKIRTHATGYHLTTSVSQTFGTPVAITPPTSFTADKAPFVSTY